eukprot:CAMPEP_0182438072 /NCGR_PEP_ID=MMETSP1167-20130531/85491_1 /TAXON_ID=2988 /ORGANISM="Mallomonas Sp, Strain CCMP3275" /LENGTH=191 /DNA_ID=CAMNT_0024631245 /DNA_START=135 /DNA_END=710 /DNA_ORIENTATION=-
MSESIPHTLPVISNPTKPQWMKDNSFDYSMLSSTGISSTPPDECRGGNQIPLVVKNDHNHYPPYLAAEHPDSFYSAPPRVLTVRSCPQSTPITRTSSHHTETSVKVNDKPTNISYKYSVPCGDLKPSPSHSHPEKRREVDYTPAILRQRSSPSFTVSKKRKLQCEQGNDYEQMRRGFYNEVSCEQEAEVAV